MQDLPCAALSFLEMWDNPVRFYALSLAVHGVCWRAAHGAERNGQGRVGASDQFLRRSLRRMQRDQPSLFRLWSDDTMERCAVWPRYDEAAPTNVECGQLRS